MVRISERWKTKQLLIKVGLPLGILLAGVAVFVLLLMADRPPERVEKSYRGPLVEAVFVPPRKVQVVVEG